MEMTPPSGSALCIPCGLCCDGSLFERANLLAGEEAFTVGLGLKVLTDNGTKTGFELACPLFSGYCSIYDQPRPHICGAFKCKLLLRYENNLIDLAAGLEKVERVRVMQATLTKILPSPAQNPPSLSEIKRQMHALSQLGPQERRAHLSFLMLAAQYEMFLRNHFIITGKKKKSDKTTTELPEMTNNTPTAN
jgi:hypothetical protein